MAEVVEALPQDLHLAFKTVLTPCAFWKASLVAKGTGALKSAEAALARAVTMGFLAQTLSDDRSLTVAALFEGFAECQPFLGHCTG